MFFDIFVYSFDNYGNYRTQMGKRSIFFRSMDKKKFIFPVVICFLIVLILNTIGKSFVNKSRSLLIETAAKINQSFQNINSKVVSIKYFLNHDINKNILKLHEANQKLAYEIENLRHLKAENEELRKILNLKKQISDKIIIAKITNVFSNDYIRSCVLNVGSSSGVEVDDIVRNRDGLIGRISEVHEIWSCVLAITDTNSKIPVKIGREQINAILNGDNSRILSVSMKNEDTSLKDGDIAETAYFENPICNRIPVGKVIESHGTFFIKPFVDFNSLQYVCILKNK